MVTFQNGDRATYEGNAGHVTGYNDEGLFGCGCLSCIVFIALTCSFQIRIGDVPA